MAVLLERAADFAAHVGKEIGESGWVPITQEMISAFAGLTGDDHWIHVDEERAAAGMPDGKTIAHGFFMLSLIPFLQRSIFTVRERGKGLNYGCNRVRFTSPVPVGSRVRLRQTVKACVAVDGGTRITFGCTMDVEGRERPALVAETLVQIQDK
ncbi:MAG: MaoC family dehydratase [Burkholderiaceae bacterium]